MLLADNREDLLPDGWIKRSIRGAARDWLAQLWRVGRDHGDVLLVLTATDENLLATPKTRRTNHWPVKMQISVRSLAKNALCAKRKLGARQACAKLCQRRILRTRGAEGYKVQGSAGGCF